MELVLIDTFVCLMPRPRPHCFLLDVWDVVVGCFGLVEYFFLFLFRSVDWADTLKKIKRTVQLLTNKLEKEKSKQKKILQAAGNDNEDPVRQIKNNCIKLQRKYKRKYSQFDNIRVRIER